MDGGQGKTTTQKLWIGFGTLTALLLLSGVAILVQVWSLDGQVDQMANVARPRAAAARELEVSVFAYALAVRSFTQTDDPNFRHKAAEAAAEAERHLADYQRLATTKRQQELAARFAALWRGYKDFSQVMLNSKDRPLKREDSERLAEMRTGLEKVLNGEMQPEAVKNYEARKETTFQDVRSIVGFAVTLLVMGVVIAVVTGVAVGRAVVRSERAIAEQGERLRTTLAGIGDAVISTDANGNVSYLNAVAESLTGWTNDEAAGVPLTQVFNIVNESSRQPVENPVLRVLREGVIVGLANHTILIAKDGTEWPIDDSAAPIRCVEGELVGCVLVFRDITERKRAEAELARERERLGIALHAGRLGVYDWHVRADAVWWSPETYSVFGVDPATFRPTTASFTALVHPDDRDALWRKTEACVARREIFDHEYRVVRPDGAIRWVYNRSHVVTGPDGEVERITGVAADITERKQAEDAVRSAEVQLRTITDTVPALIAYVDADCRYLLNNRAYELWFGHSRSEITGRHMRDVLGEDAWSVVRPKVEAALAGQTVHYESQVEYKDAGLRWIDATYVPSYGAGGEIVGVVILVNDISDHKRAEIALQEAVQQLKLVTDSMSAPVTRCSRDLRYVWVSKPYADWIGRQPDEIMGQPISDVIGGEAFARLLSRFQRVLSGEVVRYEEEIEFRGIGSRWISAVYTPTVDAAGGVDGWVAVVIDIIERKRLESELRDADRRKNEFLATLAHELRNPLAPIRNGLQVMRLAGADAGAVEKSLSMMERQLSQMVRLLDDLLDVSRITRNKLDLKKQRVELAAVVQSAVETSGPHIEQAGHEFSLTLPPAPIYLDADPTRLAQVFSNLLNNAARYTEAGSHIRLAVERQGSDVLVSVRDDGIGIAAEMLPRIFEMFTQATPALERSQSGLGIGLSLVKGLVELHGGRVEARSDGPGRGSEFTVRLPVLIETLVREVPQGDEDEPPCVAKCRILVVDDLKDSADSLAMLLKVIGHEVHTAYDGQEGVIAVEKFRPEVVLLDIGMPKLNGYEACHRIREKPLGKGIYIIALTGWGQHDDRLRTEEAGFNAHMVKPVNPRDLMKVQAGLHATA